MFLSFGLNTLLTFLTIVLFSFGANAFYNEKLPPEDCTKFVMSALTQSEQLFKSVDKGDIQASKYWRKALGETAIIYQAFCKK